MPVACPSTQITDCYNAPAVWRASFDYAQDVRRAAGVFCSKLRQMQTSPLNLTPPDDTGSDTLRRYRYQAQLIATYCLDCTTNGKVVSVIAEHFEDIVIEYHDHWHFVQIKTRNQNLGPWKLPNSIDGLKSLWRTYQCINPFKTINASYALFLEGAIAKDDLLNDLAPSDTNSTTLSSAPNANLVKKVASKLKITESDCADFLAKVVVQANQPTRQDIDSRNIRMLSQMATGATSTEIEPVYNRLVDRILYAMTGERLGNELPTFIISSNTSSISSKVARKRLTRDTIRSLLGSLAYGPSLLLQRLVEPQMPRPTNLEMKLLAAGAENKIIQDAKMLRANANVREAESLAASYDDDKLEDVRNRLSVVANSIIQKHTLDPRPAVKAFNELLTTLMDNATSCDPNRVFRQDPFILLGEVCALADECKIDWGVPIA
jgi:Cap4 dsDNA endonuclease